MGRSVKPSCMNTTGIGPAIDRRRARRTGPDEATARDANPLPPWDVPRPLKNPRRCSLQVSIMDVSVSVEALFAGEAKPSHTWPMLLAEVRASLLALASCLLTRFRRERLLGET